MLTLINIRHFYNEVLKTHDEFHMQLTHRLILYRTVKIKVFNERTILKGVLRKKKFIGIIVHDVLHFNAKIYIFGR
jgi:hypothetical protein